MAHDDIYYLIERTIDVKNEEILKDVYELVDEYNQFIRNTDKRFDKIILRMESLIENGY